MLSILAVHGINTPGPGYGSSWARALREVDVHARIDEAVWPSTGSVLADLLELRRPAFRGAALRAVREAVSAFAARPGRRGIVAHSLGAVLVAEVVARGPEAWSRLPILLVGSPHSHPVHGRVLRSWFDGWPRPGVAHLWNEDDGVCSANIVGLPASLRTMHPSWTQPIRVGVPGRTSLLGEHQAEHYLRTIAAGRLVEGWL